MVNTILQILVPSLYIHIKANSNFIFHVTDSHYQTLISYLIYQVPQTQAMKISLRTSLVFLLVLMQLSQFLTSSSAMSKDNESNFIHYGGRSLSRRFLVSRTKTPISANLGKLNGAVLEPEKAVVNGLRKRPPSSSNPTQNK